MIVDKTMETIDELARIWARYPNFWEPKLSPDGHWLAWTWIGVTEIGNVWIAPTDGSAAPARVTEEADHTYVRAFSRDGRMLLLAQSRGASERDHLILFDRASNTRSLLTPPQDDHYVFGGAFTPDGRHVLYAASYDDAAHAAIDGQRIYLHNIETGERRAVSAADTLDDTPLDLSANGRRLLYHRQERHPGGRQVWLLDLQTGEDREIVNAGDRRKALGQWLSDDQVLILAESDANDRVGILDLQTGETRWLIDDPNRSVENVVAGSDGNSVALIGYRLGRVEASRLDLATMRETSFKMEHRSVLPLDCMPNGEWIAECYSSAGPHALVRYDPGTGAFLDLSRSAEHLPAAGMTFARSAPWRWRSADGLEIHGLLYEPSGESRGLIAHVHGGPTWHSEDWIESTIQFLVGAGYTVLDPNYRGSTGYGAVFREAIKEDGWGGREQGDIRSGLESLVAAGKAVRGLIGVVGLSYGGYSSWFQITKSSDLVSAAIPICGMYHLTVDYDETGMPHGRAFSEEMMGGTPAERPQRYYEASPANFIDQIKGSLLIVHGLRDTNVSPQNSFKAARDLEGAGIHCELLTFDNEGHGIHRAGNRETLFRRMAEFLETAFDRA
jgi:dipeptidyl aminopeptidase/acylaminoacyl peptidase